MKFNRDTIKIQVTNYIRKLILNREIKPGERIIPGELAKRLNVGRATIREAIIELEKEGLVDNIPYKYTKAKIITRKEMEEICSIRALLESHALDIIQDSITLQDISNLKSILDNMNDATKNDDAESMIKADEQFHAYIVKKANNKVLYETWQFTNSRLFSLFYAVINQNNNFTFDIMVSRHHELLKILETRNINNFKDALTKHYMHLVNCVD